MLQIHFFKIYFLCKIMHVVHWTVYKEQLSLLVLSWEAICFYFSQKRACAFLNISL